MNYTLPAGERRISPPEATEYDLDDVWAAIRKAARDAFDRHCHTAGGLDTHTADTLADEVAYRAIIALADAKDDAWEKWK